LLPLDIAMEPIDLEELIDTVRGLKSDLESYYGATRASASAHDLHALGLLTNQVAQRITAFEDVLRHQGSGTLRWVGLDGAEANRLSRALDVLDVELRLPEGRPSRAHWTAFRTVLGALDDVLLALVRAVPASSEVPDGEARTSARTVLFSIARSAK
jgi:hypothetical protein